MALSHHLSVLDIIFDHMPMGVAIIDRDLSLHRWNPTWLGFVKRYTPTPVSQVKVGAKFFDIIPDVEEAAAPVFRQVLDGETVRFDGVRIESGGIESYWDLVFSPLFDNGEVVGIVHVTTDATERKKTEDDLRKHQSRLEELVEERAGEIRKANELLQLEIAEREKTEEALRTSEEKYRDLVENANSIILRMDAMGRVTFFNEFAQKFFGYTADEIIGKNVVGTIVPAADTSGQDLVKMIEDIGQHPERYSTNENENMCRNGERVWVAWTNKAIVHERGNVAEVLCVGNDVTDRKLAEEALRSARDELATLLEIGQAANSSLEMEEVLSLIARRLAAGVGVRHCGIYLVDEAKGLLFPTEGTAGPNPVTPNFDQAYRNRPLDPLKDAFTRQVLERKEPLACHNAETDPRMDKETVRLLGLKSVLAVPFVVKDRVVAVAMIVTFDHHHTFTDEQIRLAKGIANAAAMAIENARLYRDEQKRHREDQQRRRVAESLRGILAKLNSSSPLEEILDYIVAEACQVLSTDAGAIYRLNADGQTLPIQAARGLDANFVSNVIIPVGRGAVGRAVQNRQPFTISDTTSGFLVEDGFVGTELEPYLMQLIDYYRTMLSVPLIVKEEVYGGITLYYSHRREFSTEEIALVVAFGDQAALAIENARLRAKAVQVAAAAERNRLARDLHDAVTQTLFSASLVAEVLPRLWDRNPQEGRRRLEELRQLTRGALAEMRTLLLELRPATLTEAGLGDLLRHLTEAVTGWARIPVSLEIEGEAHLPPDVQVVLYRIAQEALNNVGKHAGARKATVELRHRAGKVELCVSDDGCGFDPFDVAPERLGLDIMRERAEAIGALLDISSKQGCGTRVAVVWQDSARMEDL